MTKYTYGDNDTIVEARSYDEFFENLSKYKHFYPFTKGCPIELKKRLCKMYDTTLAGLTWRDTKQIFDKLQWKGIIRHAKESN